MLVSHPVALVDYRKSRHHGKLSVALFEQLRLPAKDILLQRATVGCAVVLMYLITRKCRFEDAFLSVNRTAPCIRGIYDLSLRPCVPFDGVPVWLAQEPIYWFFARLDTHICRQTHYERLYMTGLDHHPRQCCARPQRHCGPQDHHSILLRYEPKS